MGLSLLDAIRINTSTFAWSSCEFTIDGQSNESIVSVDYEEKLELRIIPSNIQDQTPLGMSLGRYQVGTFPLRMLSDSGLALKRYLGAKAKASGIPSGSYGQATFDMCLQLSGLDAPDGSPSTVLFASCRIIGESVAHEEGVGAAVTEFKVACLAIQQDNLSLFDSFATASIDLPGTDTITVAGFPAPGKWTLTKAAREYGWDIRKGYGISGAVLVPTGDEPLVVDFLIEIWTPQDYALFQIFRSQYLKKALVSVPGGATGAPFDIGHPELQALNAAGFVVKTHPALMNDGFGVWTGTASFLESRKPQPAMQKSMGDAVIPDVGEPRPTALTQTQVELQAAKQYLQKLPD